MDILLVLILGILSGLFINYTADILPITRRFSKPVCLMCQNPVGWGRYCLLRRCEHCGERRSNRTIVIMIALPLLLIWMWLTPPARIGFVLGWLVLVYFALVATIDLEYRAILHPTSIAGAILGVVTGITAHDIMTTILGCLVGAGIMLALYYFGILFVRIYSKIKKQQIDEVALGFGDVILGGILGLMVGWPEIIGALISAILLAGLISALLMVGSLLLKRYKALTAIPYAPFLLLGAAIFVYIPK